MINWRRRGGGGGRIPGYWQMSWKTIFFAASPVPGRIRGDGGRRERVRGVPQIGRGKGRRLGRVPNTRRLPATVDRSPLERTSPRRSTPAVGHSPSGCILARPVAVRRPVSRAAPVRPLGARRSVVGGRAGPGIGRARAVLGRTGLAGRASLVTSSTSGREAVCRRSGGAPGIGQTPSSWATPGHASDSPDFGFS